MFSFHSTAKLQLLNVALIFPFKTFCAEAIKNWLSNYPGRNVGNIKIAQLFNEAYARVAVVKTAVNVLKKTGILPVSANIFGPGDFLTKPHPSPSGEYFMVVDQPSSSCKVQQNDTAISHKGIREMPVIIPATAARRGSATFITRSPHKYKAKDSEAKKKLSAKKKKFWHPNSGTYKDVKTYNNKFKGMKKMCTQ